MGPGATAHYAAIVDRLAIPANPLRAWVSPGLWLAGVTLWLDALTGLLGLGVLLITMAGLFTMPLLIGLPMFVVAGGLIWRLGDYQRRILATGTGAVIARPDPPDSKSRIRRIWGYLRNRHTWRQLGYWAVRTPLSFITVSGTVLALALPITLALLPTYWFTFPTSSASVGPITVDNPVTAAIVSACAVGFGVMVSPLIIKLLIEVDLAVARRLLGGTSLTRRVEELTVSRAQVVDAAEAERQRIERDLHDGAQQRLISVAVIIGRVKVRLRASGAAADQELLRLLDQAHADAKTAITELRDLTRGLHPPVLTDRGLDAALSALAGRMPIPVEIWVAPELTGDHRPPAATESAAYFVVSESLTNAAKHSAATKITVRIGQSAPGRVLVEVTDDGRGGAQLSAGGGLAGLAGRVQGIDGTFNVDSPPGGPTMIRAELPCES